MRFMMTSYPGSPSNGANMGQNLLNCEFTANPPSNALASLFKEQFRKQFRAIQDTHKLSGQFRIPTDLNAFFGHLPRNDSAIDGCPELLN